MTKPVWERLFNRVDRSAAGGCWEWTGALRNGYGVISAGAAGAGTLYTHRVAYELRMGALPPKGWDLDHRCRNTRCCNPDHLQAVPHRVNVLRGTSSGARVQRTGMCAKGLHEFAGSNIVTYGNGDRTCRACRDARMAAWEAKRRGVDLPPPVV